MTAKHENSKASTANQTPRRGEKFRRAAIKTAGAVAILAVAGGSLFALTRGHSGPAYDKKTEAGIERVIDGSLEQAGKMALSDHNAVQWQPAAGVTEINDSTDGGNIGFSVAFGNFPGTNRPNPKDVLAAQLMDGSGSAAGDFTDDGVVLARPNSVQDLLGGGDFGISGSGEDYKLDQNGYTAMHIYNSGAGYLIDTDHTLDTADSSRFATGANGASLGPVGTARVVVGAVPHEISDIESALHITHDQ